MRTPEEIRKGLQCCKNSECEECRYFDGSGSWSCVGRLIKDVFAYVQQLEAQQPRWVSVGERLPENDDEVLCWYEYYRYGDYNAMYQTYGIGYYLNGTWGGEVSNGQKARVLYWMPLPPGPEEKDEC